MTHLNDIILANVATEDLRALEKKATEETWPSIAAELHSRDFKAAQEQYPNACVPCNGSGIIPDPGSYWEQPSEDTCGHCLDKDICPVCAKKVTLVDEGSFDHFVCKHCGYDDRKAEPVLPPGPY